MYLGIKYIHAANHSLNAFTGLTPTSIAILDHLSSFSSAVSYKALHALLCEGHGNYSKTSYHPALYKLVADGYVLRTPISKERYFSITTLGRKLLNDFNLHLEQTVQAKINKYRRLQDID